MGYNINLGGWRSVFAVPSEVVDKHLRLAGAAQLKTLLYLLRHGGESIGLEELAAAIGLSEADTADAVGYWVTCGLLTEADDGLNPVGTEEAPAATAQDAEQPCTANAGNAASCDSLLTQTTEQAQPVTENEQTAALPMPKRKERIRYNYSECCEMMTQDGELRDMLKLLEGLMARQLNYSEISVFIALAKWWGMQPASVVLLAEYCRSIGKLSIAYIESTGIGWAGEGILQVEQANEKILRLRAARSAWTIVRTTLGLAERAPTARDEEFSIRWINEWHTDTKLIKLAYDRCIDNKGKLSMSYINAIIASWRKKELYSIEQVMQSDIKPQDKSAATKSGRTDAQSAGRYSPTYDKDEIESMLDEEWSGE